MSAAALQPGTLFAGEYRVVSLLNGGGMGSVYIVEQESTGARRALKVMHAYLLDDKTMHRRFATEARVCAQIESDHVVDVVAAGVDAATGTPWLVMELLTGEDLEAYMRRAGSLPAAEVRVAAYGACVTAGRCMAPRPGDACNWGIAARSSHPINCVDWNHANTFCKAHGKRLPTEEEWEYAARAEQGRKFPWGAAAPSQQPCWNGEGSPSGRGKRESTCEAGSFAGDKSAFGVLDMAGNVSEWTASHYCPYPVANCASPFRVVRGATWADFAVASFRSTYRARSLPAELGGSIGFRCARTP